jgi:hypothetical protein
MLAKGTVFLILLWTCLLPANAADLKIHTAKPGSDGAQLWVQFETPVALTDCDVEYATKAPKKTPVQCTVTLTAAPWDVVVYDKKGDSSTVLVTSSSDLIGNLPANGLVRLDLANAVPADFSRIDVTFTNTKGKLAHFSVEKGTPPTTKWVSPAKTKDDSNVYISGTFAPADGSSPSYTIDSKGSYILHSFENGTYAVSATGDVNTDKKPTADPDSFHWAIPVQYVSKSNFTAQLPTLGMELDKKGNAINLVSAPSFTRAFGHVFTGPDAKNPETKKVAAAIGLELTGGLEFGSNLKNDFAVANKTLGGQGWFLRGVPSASVYLIVPKVWRLNKISLTSSYTARIPTTDEVFIETRHTAKPVPELTSNTRNYIQNTLTFMLTDYVGIQIKHQYGSLPPAFSFVQNSGSIGLVFALKETRVPQ